MHKYFTSALLSLAVGSVIASPKDTNCMWVQAYTDVRLANCLIAPDGMLLVPKRSINRATAAELLLTATVASGMQKVPQPSISVALDPSLKRYLKVDGKPVEFRVPDENIKAARQAFEKRIVRCELKANWDTVCSDGSNTKLTPIN